MFNILNKTISAKAAANAPPTELEKIKDEVDKVNDAVELIGAGLH